MEATSVSESEQKITELKQKVTKRRREVLNDSVVKTYLGQLHRQFVIFTIHEASYNFTFIWKKLYITELLSEYGLNGYTTYKTYSQVSITKEEIVNSNITYCKKLGNRKAFPIMHWLSRMHKRPIGSRFIIASKTFCTKQLPDVVSKVFKMAYNHVEMFHVKSRFYCSFKNSGL